MNTRHVASAALLLGLFTLGLGSACTSKKNSTPVPPPTQHGKQPQPTGPQQKVTQPTPVITAPDINIPGGTSLDQGALALDGSSNEIFDDLAANTDGSGYSLTANYALTLPTFTTINVTDVQPFISNANGNSCNYESYIVLQNSVGKAVASVQIPSTVTQDLVIQIGSTQPAGTYKLSVLLQSPSACTVDFTFQATKALSNVVPGSTSPGAVPAVPGTGTGTGTGTGVGTTTPLNPPVAPAGW